MERDLMALVRRGVYAWNQWRNENPSIRPDLSRAELQHQNLEGADLRGVDLSGAALMGADLTRADLRGSTLHGVKINDARAWYADFGQCHMRGAYLWGTDFREANFAGADLTGANLRNAQLVMTKFPAATLTGCKVYGIAAWDIDLSGATQSDLNISAPNQRHVITVDSLEVAQFIYLLLSNKKVRDVLKTVTSKMVLILGRFTSERKAVLDLIREHITDARSVAGELERVVGLPSVPVQLLLHKGHGAWGMADDIVTRGSVLRLIEYSRPEEIAEILPRILEAAEQRAGAVAQAIAQFRADGKWIASSSIENGRA